MSNRNEAIVAYFTSITHCQRDEALKLLERNHWRLDQSLNLFFEQDHNRQSLASHGRRIDASVPSRSSSETIIIPAMIAFQRFLESFDSSLINLLDNASKMMAVALQYARHKPPILSSSQLEHWNIHVKVDYTRLQTLLDHDMCAPLVWIEHFEHLLNGNRCQLFDCDYMFDTSLHSR